MLQSLFLTFSFGQFWFFSELIAPWLFLSPYFTSIFEKICFLNLNINNFFIFINKKKKKDSLRTMSVFVLICLHLSTIFLLNLGSFPFIAISILFGMLEFFILFSKIYLFLCFIALIPKSIWIFYSDFVTATRDRQFTKIIYDPNSRIATFIVYFFKIFWL